MYSQGRVAGIKNSRLVGLVLIGCGLIILGFIAITLIAAGDKQNNFSVIPSAVNFPAPELFLNDLQGEKVSLSDYRNQVVLVNNWAVWCPPCKNEMPALAQYYQEHAEQGFTVIGIDAGDSAEEVQRFVQDYRLPFPIWLDPNTKSMAKFHNESLPSSYVIDRTGTVVFAWTGPINHTMLEKYITPLLEQ